MKWIHLSNQFQCKLTILSAVMFAVLLRKNSKSYEVVWLASLTHSHCIGEEQRSLSFFQCIKIAKFLTSDTKYPNVSLWYIEMYWDISWWSQYIVTPRTPLMSLYCMHQVRVLFRDCRDITSHDETKASTRQLFHELSVHSPWTTFVYCAICA